MKLLSRPGTKSRRFKSVSMERSSQSRSNFIGFLDLLVRRWGYVFLLLKFIAIGAVAQSPPAAVTGTVRDQSGASVSSAVVRLIASGSVANSSEARTTRTGIDGMFSFDRVTLGAYDIQVQQEGFK